MPNEVDVYSFLDLDNEILLYILCRKKYVSRTDFDGRSPFSHTSCNDEFIKKEFLYALSILL